MSALLRDSVFRGEAGADDDPAYFWESNEVPASVITTKSTVIRRISASGCLGLLVCESA
jgi:hypothetical protein